MNNANIQKPRRSFLLIVFLVLALGFLAALSYFSHKNSDELARTVQRLRDNRYDIDRIDQAIQLLYKAENNSRAFVLTWDPVFQEVYLEQLGEVSRLVDSISRMSDNAALSELVEEKRAKTEVFIRARQLADSLLKINAAEARRLARTPAPVTAGRDTASLQPLVEKRVIDETIVTEKTKKGLLGRIAAAIANKPREKTIQNVTVYRHLPSDSASGDQQAPRNIQTVSLLPLTPAFSSLSEKEKELLEANGRLFSELQAVLLQLKTNEQIVFKNRQRKLSDNASRVIERLRSNHNYILVFSIVLTVIILWVLGKLFVNHKDLQKARLEAEAHARYKSEFIALLSHEIRTPLQNIQGYSGVLSRQQTPRQQADAVRAIQLSARNLLAIINNILDFSKIEHGKFRLNHAPFIPAKVAREVCTSLALQAREKQLEIRQAMTPAADTEVYGDAFYFRQLLTNLLSNAIKYTTRGYVEIKADFIMQDAIKGNLHVEVRDTGSGIEKEKIPEIFQPYNAPRHDTEIREGSTGLGLSVVKKIVDFHNGTLHVESEPGVGSAFYLSLPYDRFLRSSDPEATGPGPGREVRKLLINENDKLISRYLGLLFKDKDYVLTMTNSGTEAFKALTENEFDLIMTDIAMPGMSGQELLEKIRNMPDTHKSGIPVIALTGFEEPEAAPGVLRFDAWITKPFNAEELMAQIDRLCALDYRRQGNQESRNQNQTKNDK